MSVIEATKETDEKKRPDWRDPNRKTMDPERIEREMKIMAEKRIDRIAGKEELLLTRAQAARIFNRPVKWLDDRIAEGRIPSTRIGRIVYINRPAVIEALVYGM